MALVDAPDALQGVAARPVTTVAPQALMDFCQVLFGLNGFVCVE